jgi:hypothetical protein
MTQREKVLKHNQVITLHGNATTVAVLEQWITLVKAVSVINALQIWGSNG